MASCDWQITHLTHLDPPVDAEKCASEFAPLAPGVGKFLRMVIQAAVVPESHGAAMLDADECFHLALHAAAAGQHHACITYLKEVLQQQPENASAIYLLAAQHAELGLFERAVRGMKAALALEPTIEIARFQLGMLLLGRDRRAEARENFAALSGSSDSALRTFSEAMVALADGRSRVARELLAAGLSQQSINPAWSSLMRRVFDDLLRSEQATTGKPDGPDNQAFLGAYRHTSS